MRVTKKQVDNVTRWTLFDDMGKRVETFNSEEQAYLAAGLCPERVSSGSYDWRGHVCAKPIKTEGASLCNFHLSVIRRRQEKQEAAQRSYQAKQSASAKAHTREDDLHKRVAKLVGEKNFSTWNLRAHYSNLGRHDGYLDPSTFEIGYDLLVQILEAAEKHAKSRMS